MKKLRNHKIWNSKTIKHCQYILDFYQMIIFSTMCDHLEYYRNKILPKRDTISNSLPTVYVKYNVPKAIRSMGVDEKGKVAHTAPARINRIGRTLRSALEKKASDKRSKFKKRQFILLSLTFIESTCCDLNIVSIFCHY